MEIFTGYVSNLIAAGWSSPSIKLERDRQVFVIRGGKGRIEWARRFFPETQEMAEPALTNLGYGVGYNN